MRIHLAVLSGALALAGCFPTRETYLDPSGLGNTHAPRPCGGAPSEFELSLPAGVRATIYAFESNSGLTRVSIEYRVPTGATLRMTSGEVSIRNIGTGVRVSRVPTAVRQQCGTGASDYACERAVQPSTLLTGATIKDGSLLGAGRADRGMFVDLEFTGAFPPFELMLPELEVNGIRVAGNAVTYRRTTGVVWKAMCS
jgi:hypothetical protein